MSGKKIVAFIGSGWLWGCLLAGCYTPLDPVEINAIDTMPDPDRSVPAAGLDYNVVDLTDPNEIATLAFPDLLILSAEQFWESELDLDAIRMANPNLKIVGYFRTKCVRSVWGDTPPDGDPSYTQQLYQTALPHLVRTTEGDTASDWVGTYLYDFTNAQVRSDMLDIFIHYQLTSANKFDGVFWDYFSPKLFVPHNVTTVAGDPDMDGDGVPHDVDDDEQQRFLAAQDDWVAELRAALGEDFIQIANGVRALRDSTFAAKLDGMFYENFPYQAFFGADPFAMSVDPAEFNNLFTARNWPRTRNGGPWLILSHYKSGGTYFDSDFEPVTIDVDDLCRALAMLTDATSICYIEPGTRDIGYPEIEYNLGSPLGGVTVDGNLYARDFEHGRIEVTMRSGDLPFPFNYVVYQDGQILDRSTFPDWGK